jgi:outer membrane protein assembly factor BamB
MRGLMVGVALLGIAALTRAEPGEWITFHGDFGRTGHSAVDFPTCAFGEAWTFSLGPHTWRYERGTSVWSASPAIAKVADTWMVFIGAYDSNLYAIDAETGEELWRFTTGGPIAAAPTFARIGERSTVFVAGTDRTLYAVDAETGEERWNYETLPWSYTVHSANAGSPVVARAGGRTAVFASFHNSDRKPVRNIERAELIALEADTGQRLWARELTDHPITAPVYLAIDGEAYLFVGSEDGCIYAVRARDGEPAWKKVLTHAVGATPCGTWIAGTPVLLVPDRWGMVNCLNARSGALIWNHKTGHEVLSTPAAGATRNGPAVFVGSSDRSIRALDAKSSLEAWRFATGKYVTASPVLCNVVGKAAIICSSLDNHLYVLDAETGTPIWDMASGDMLWAYETRGSTPWSSPAVATLGTTPMIFYPAYDGKLYALKCVPRCLTEEGVPEVYATSRSGTPSPPPSGLLALGILMSVAGLGIIVGGRFIGGRRAGEPS